MTGHSTWPKRRGRMHDARVAMGRHIHEHDRRPVLTRPEVEVEVERNAWLRRNGSVRGTCSRTCATRGSN